MTHPDADPSIKRRRVPRTFTALAIGFAAGNLCQYVEFGNDKHNANINTAEELGHTTSCNEDPLSIVDEGKTYVIADGRCRNGGAQIEVMSYPNEATVGSIAKVDTGALIEATCTVEGQPITLPVHKEPTTNKWVRVILSQRMGVTFQSENSDGYVWAGDVVGDTSLPMCNSNRRDA